jgi:hypothetical protein
MRAAWVTYFNVRSMRTKIAFYKMSSPVLFMPQEQWHTVRIIISVETNLFTCRGASLFILLMNSSHSCAVYGLSAVSQREWFLKREYWFELKYSHILHFYLMCTSPGFLSFLQGSFTLSQQLFYMSFSCPMPHDCKNFFFLFSFLRETKIPGNLICIVQSFKLQ